MLHPRVALSASQRSHSATKRDAVSAVSHHRQLSPSVRGIHADPAVTKSSAFSTIIPAGLPKQHTPAGDDALVSNLKQQIQCLELEVKYLKTQPTPQSQQQRSPTRGGDGPHSVTSAEARTRHMNTTIGSQSGANRVANDELLRRADELEDEVTDLRQQFAIREQEHHLELASLRQLIDTDKRNAGTQRSLREELERRDAQVKHDVSSLKQLHAQEVVALQNTVERVKLERENANSDIRFLTEERDASNSEVVALRDTARSNLLMIEGLQKQLQEAMLHLTQEQGLRRGAEVRESTLKENNEDLQTRLSKLQLNETDRDDANRQHEGALQGKNFEIDQLRLTVGRQKEDLTRMAAEMSDAKAKVTQAAAKVADLEGKLGKSGQTITDIQSEREFFRLQCDRLKVENSVLEVRAQHLEQSLNAERVSLTNMERQLCAALDQAEQLRRESRQKEDVYRRIDDYSSTVRVQLRLVEQERGELRKRLEEALASLESLSERYAQVKHLEDQKKLEQQLQQALLQLAKSKHEMQAILAHQQRVTDDFNNAMIDLPEVTHNAHNVSVALSSKTVSPTRSSRHVAAGAVTIQDHATDDLLQHHGHARSAVVEPLEPAATIVVSEERNVVTTVTVMSQEEVQQELRELTQRISDEESRAAEVLHKKHD